MQIKSAMLRDIYKMAEEKAKDLSKQPAPKKPEMSQADKERSLGAVHSMTNELSKNPEIQNQAFSATTAAGGMPVPGLISKNPRSSAFSGPNFAPSWEEYQASIARLPAGTQRSQDLSALESAYGDMLKVPSTYFEGMNRVPNLADAILRLRQQSLLDNLGE